MSSAAVMIGTFRIKSKECHPALSLLVWVIIILSLQHKANGHRNNTTINMNRNLTLIWIQHYNVMVAYGSKLHRNIRQLNLSIMHQEWCFAL